MPEMQNKYFNYINPFNKVKQIMSCFFGLKKQCASCVYFEPSIIMGNYCHSLKITLIGKSDKSHACLRYEKEEQPNEPI